MSHINLSERFKRIISAFEEEKELEYIRTNQMLNWAYSNLWNININKALYYFFGENNLQNAKAFFYLSGKVKLFEMKKYPQYEHMKLLNLIDMTFILLSDSPNLIKSASEATTPWYEYQVSTGAFVYSKAIQCILKNDENGLRNCIEIIEKKLLKTVKKESWEMPNYEALHGFLNKDVLSIESSINKLLTPKMHKHWNRYTTTTEYISHPALGYAKLAWMKGMEVEVNNRLVPRELLPVQPLAVYPEYEFILAEEAKTPLTK